MPRCASPGGFKGCPVRSAPCAIPVSRKMITASRYSVMAASNRRTPYKAAPRRYSARSRRGGRRLAAVGSAALVRGDDLFQPHPRQNEAEVIQGHAFPVMVIRFACVGSSWSRCHGCGSPVCRSPREWALRVAFRRSRDTYAAEGRCLGADEHFKRPAGPPLGRSSSPAR